jgi:hypothetical protein
MPPASTGGPARANLAALGHEPPQSAEVLEVHALDVFLAEIAILAPTRTRCGTSTTLLLLGTCHLI